MKKLGVLFICMGNICRSPLAEGVFRRQVEEAGLSGMFLIDSAGTHGYHTGASPDRRSIAVAREFNYCIEEQRSRLMTSEDFTEFDYMLAMDKRNLRDLTNYAPTKELAQKPKLLLDYSREPLTEMEVPDPYYDDNGFQHVLKLVESGCSGFLETLREEGRI